MKVIVLDFDKSIAYVYALDDFKEEFDVEEFLENKGHRTNNCQWMVTNNKIITL